MIISSINYFFLLFINLFSFITHTKSSKIVLLGELDHYKPFGLLRKGFFIGIFLKKEGFLKEKVE